MRRFIIVFFCLLPLLIYSQKRKYQNEVPPGTIEVSKDFFIDQTEITNFDWLEYLYWLERKFGKSSNEFQAALPDSTVWENYTHYDSLTIFRFPAYRNHPIVGISFQQAIAYCKWRSNMVNTYIYLRDFKLNVSVLDTLNPNTIPKKFEYRLPTGIEWIDCSRIPYKKKHIKKTLKKDMPLDNFTKKGNGYEYAIEPVMTYYPNSRNFYNLFGNVAEMIQDDSTRAMGGSWRHEEQVSKSYSGISYDTPTNWIGFRCVAVRIRS